MRLSKKVKTALDETRLLILGAQVLFGFQFNGMFQEAFSDLSLPLRLVLVTSLCLLILTLGLLIAPSMQHRIVERGEDTNRIHSATTALAGFALLPLALALGLDVFTAIERSFGPTVGATVGGLFFLLSIAFWYAFEMLVRENTSVRRKEAEEATPLSAKVEQMLTEARVIIPGAQALLGFQLTVTLTRAFESLPYESKLAHAVALCCIALSIILLMATAAVHRISFAGEDSPRFLTIGSWFVITGPFPLAVGVALDTYVATARALESTIAAAWIAALTAMLLMLTWYAYPLLLRARQR
jgi:hypothetical protein